MHHFAISMYDILILAVLCLTFMLLPSMDVGELPPVPRFFRSVRNCSWAKEEMPPLGIKRRSEEGESVLTSQ